MKPGKKGIRAAVAATAIAIGATAFDAAPAFAYGSTGWLPTDGIYTFDGCGVYSTLGTSWGRPRSEASETYPCAGWGQSGLLYRDLSGSSFQEFGTYDPTDSSAMATSPLWVGTNHKAIHNH
jgi:hypothetical protein